MPASIDLNLIIKDDKLVDKYLHVNKEAIVHNYDNNIPSTVKISRFAHMGNYNFILTIETAAMNYDMITNYINSHNGKFIITLNFNDNDNDEFDIDIDELVSKVEDEIATDLNVWNDITKKTPLCPTLSLEVEREWSNGVKCTYIETEVELTADMFSIYDDSMQLVPFKSSTGYHRPIANPFIKFDDETYKVFVKYLNDNDYKLLIRHNCGPTIDFDYIIIALIGNNTFVVNMMQFSNHPVSYEIFKDYLESHNNKLELTFNFIKKNEECV